MEKKTENTNPDSIRHSLAHILAMAVLERFPKAKLGIGPVIENGFYYDFKLPKPLSPEDLPDLEARMKALLAQNLEFTGEKITPAKAKKLFKDQPFKLDLIKDFLKEGKTLAAYHACPPKIGNQKTKTKNKKQKTGTCFTDLCKGGHVKNTSEINPEAFKLSRIAGAYWRGDEKKPQLTRIYGIAFETKQDLQEYERVRAESAARDHKKLGKELGLFVFSDLVGPGLPLYTPAGTLVLKAIKDYLRALRDAIGYREVQTPNMNKGELFKRSGHYEKFRENLFEVRSNYTDEEYFLKPMNCPQHTQLFAAEPRSYRDLPLKYADFAMLYRDEKPGELSGLARLRSFSQDDGHCFCREDQIENEFELVLGAISEAMRRFGLRYYIRLSLRDEKNKKAYLGSDEIWKKSQATLENLLKKHGINFMPAAGEAAFYGPKMDLIVKDSLDREWQLSTIQLDFNMPERFGLAYVAEDGVKKTPIMIHSALVGSPERFLGILIEHCAGAFPFWLSPVQIGILVVTDAARDYAEKVASKIREAEFRVSMDDRNETIGKKIREAELKKMPYLLIVGNREAQSGTVAVRERGKGDVGAVPLAKFLGNIKSLNI